MGTVQDMNPLKPYAYYKLLKSDTPAQYGKVVATSRKPILQESAIMFGTGYYKVMAVAVIPAHEEQGRYPVLVEGKQEEHEVINFQVYDNQADEIPVDLDMLNMSMMSNMFEKVKKNILTSFGRKVDMT